MKGGDAGAQPSFTEVVAAVRGGIVGVRSALGAAGTGYIALSSGAVATRLGCVGFERDAMLSLDDGRTVAARVVAVDVARDLAVLAPLGALLARALPPAAGLPPLGAWVIGLTRDATSELSVSCGLLSAVHDGGRRARAEGLQRSAAVVSDAEGRVIGLCEADGALVPAAEYAPLLSQLDMPLAELTRVTPVYRCPACGQPLSLEVPRCSSCGARLPGAPAPEALHAAGEAAIRTVLSALGRSGMAPHTNRPRVVVDGDHTIELSLDESGEVLLMRAPIAQLPDRDLDAVLRLLLTLNDATTGLHQLSLDGATVMLSIALPAGTVSQHSAAAVAHELARAAEHYGRLLAGAYRMNPVRW